MRASARILFSLLLIAAIYPAQASYPMQAQQVANNVYAIITPTRELPNPENRGWNSNSAFVITEDGVLLFDSGSSTSIGMAIKQTIASVTNKPVRWIINSHSHGDHWLGNAAFKDSVQQIYASDLVAKTIKVGGRSWIDLFNRMTLGATGESEIVPPDTTISEATTLTLGGQPIELFPSGNSHSPGDLILWLPDERILISGDVVYSDRMPSTNAGTLRQWIDMLQQLQDRQPDVVIPGHGEVTDIQGLKRLQALLQDLWLAVEQGYEAGLSDYEMLPQVIQALSTYSNEFPGLEDKLKRDISHVFLQVEAASFE